MASTLPSSVASLFSSSSSAIRRPHALSSSSSTSSVCFASVLRRCSRSQRSSAARAQTVDLPYSFFASGDEDSNKPLYPTFGSSAAAAAAAAAMGEEEEQREERQCPPGLRQYETMVVLRPDVSEAERIELTQKYEELLVTGGGMYVEIFHRGTLPLAYPIRMKDYDGVGHVYWEGIYLLFSYYTKPESMAILEKTLKSDFDIIRSSNFKIEKRRVKVKKEKTVQHQEEEDQQEKTV